MRSKLPWVLLAASLLLNALFVSGVLFGWAGQGRGIGSGDRLAEVAEQLDLTQSQQDALKDLKRQFRERRQDFGEARRSLRSAILDELRQETFDRESMIEILDAQSMHRQELFVDIAQELHGYLAGLSPTQREAFLEMASERGFLRALFFDGGKGKDARRDG